VAAEHDVGVPLGDGLQHALDADVDDLHARRTRQRHRPEAEREQGLHERHRQVPGAGVEEEQPLDRLAPHRAGVGQHALPARPLVRGGAVPEDALPRVASRFSPSMTR
jgi:hypothetical protein